MNTVTAARTEKVNRHIHFDEELMQQRKEKHAAEMRVLELEIQIREEERLSAIKFNSKREELMNLKILRKKKQIDYLYNEN